MARADQRPIGRREEQTAAAVQQVHAGFVHIRSADGFAPANTNVVSAPSLTSSRLQQKAQQNRGMIDFVGLQTYWWGGAANSAAKPSFCNCWFKFLGTSVITVR
jgi:hypothetical protein